MPTKSNHEFKEKYPNVPVGILEQNRIKDILTSVSCILPYAVSILEYE